ncbi:MAG TPA: alpha/beta hydrolase [Mycobacteriales bacterium]|nr:alpha/beta hydrolase [Mycobacteriales bacterium]
MRTVTTDLLEIAYEDEGPPDGPPLLLLHGWPDSPRAWQDVAPLLHEAGFRTIVPALRGFAPTRFRDPGTPRTAQTVALAQDALDLLDGLGIERAAVVGHDWGARAGYALAALVPDRLSALVAISVGYEPGGAVALPSFEQARLWWYQWFQTLDAGADAVRADPVGFARLQWDTWSPRCWYEEPEFIATAAAFEHSDFVPITLHGYRVRWGASRRDPAYDELERRVATVRTIGVRTLVVHGGSDTCVAPEATEDKACHFTGGYQRVVVPGAGHFVPREAPGSVADAVVAHLR